jgi:hypothetical protein
MAVDWCPHGLIPNKMRSMSFPKASDRPDFYHLRVPVHVSPSQDPARLRLHQGKAPAAYPEHPRPILFIQGLIYRDRFSTRRSEDLKSNLEVARAAAGSFEQFIRHVLVRRTRSPGMRGVLKKYE